MAKGLRNMSEIERREAVRRRLANGTKGLGYWAAVDAQKRIEKAAEEKKHQD